MLDARPRPPGNISHLQRLVAEIAGVDGEVKRIQRAIANTIVGQMLPPGVVKGGTAIKLRLGEAHSRFTPDLDAARKAGLAEDDYMEAFALRLREGWSGFTGTVEADTKPAPPDVPDDYIMSPYRVRLSYRGREWLKVRFELGRDEVGSTVVAEPRMAEDVVSIFAALGLPAPEPVPLMPVAHQVAQKLHACTSINPRTGGNERAHDLVDLQLLARVGVDLPQTAVIARRLFASRRLQPWPPTVVVFSKWDTIYAEAADGLEVLPNVEQAAAWANVLIADLDTAAPLDHVTAEVARTRAMMLPISETKPQEHTTPACPRCGSATVAWILRGDPAFSEQLESDLSTGRVVLGGCLVGPDQASHHCNACGLEFRTDGRPVRVDEDAW
jgi:hypothetical protein